MDKVAAEKIAEVLAEVEPVLLSLVAERDSLREKIASYERHEKAEKLASAMHQKGINADVPLNRLTADLEKAAEQGKLSSIEAAVDLVGPDMGKKMASLINDDNKTQSSSTDLERYIVGSL